MLRRFLLLLAAGLGLLPLALQAQREKLPPEDLAWVEQNFPNAKKSNTGIRYDILESGSGEKAKPGDMVSVLYVGRLLNGQTFDQVSDREKPFRFRVGRGHVIQGWDQILQLMRPGDKWVVIIPSELAYGSRGTGRIPRDATLVFMMELLAAGPN
ncbi:MAG: FKBP-type peptidyl-prolyl cis-trans isomerase [Opitutaceae bacterium]|nr:FKBP-type peptidyl-prolyl cis-trans isomerase [Opitutaceae bacterium]